MSRTDPQGLTALIVGLDPSLLVDDDAPVNAARVRRSMDDAVADLREDGIATGLFLLAGPTPATIEALRATVAREQPDIVMVGAGVRLEPSLSWFLESLVNTVLDVAPHARLCFNEAPEAMATAVRRVASSAGHRRPRAAPGPTV